MILRSFLSCLLLLVVSACAQHIDKNQSLTIAGNPLHIDAGRFDDKRFIRIKHEDIPWKSTYAGGEAKVSKRKGLFKKLTNQAMESQCQPHGYVTQGDPVYQMLENNPSAQYGLLGYLIAEAMSDYDNLPVSSYQKFLCKDELDAEELQAR